LGWGWFLFTFLASVRRWMENFQAVKDTLLVTSSDGKLHIRDGASASLPLLGTLIFDEEYVQSVNFSSDNTKLLCVLPSRDDRVIVWDVASLKEIAILRLASSPIHACFNSYRENELVTSDDAQIAIWNYAEVRILRTIANKRYDTFCRTIVDECRIVAPGFGDGVHTERTLNCWDYESGQGIVRLEFKQTISEISQCPADCNEIAVGFSTGKIVLVDLATSTVKFERSYHQEEVTCIRYSSGGDRLCSCACDGLAVVLDTTNGTITVVNIGANLLEVALCFGETHVVVANESEVRVYCIASGEKVMSLERENGGIICSAYSSQVILL
jgi:WD40 repeat protein